MIFHVFSMGDVEDPELYAALPISEWQKTDKGRWVMKHGHDLTFHINPDPTVFGYKVIISGSLKPEDEVYYTLKYR